MPYAYRSMSMIAGNTQDPGSKSFPWSLGTQVPGMMTDDPTGIPYGLDMVYSYTLLTAFSEVPNGGNPAAVVYMDLNTHARVLGDIAQNLNQPITAFVSTSPLPCDKPKTAAFAIRWFTATRSEIAICGHGTLAAAKAVLDREDVANDTEVVEFHTMTRGILAARRREGGLIEIELPSTITTEVSQAEYTRLSGIINRATGKEVVIKYIGRGGKDFDYYLFIVLDESEDLKNLRIDGAPLRESGSSIHVFTTECSNGSDRFVSRMFAPHDLIGDEDHVCGSAHCLLGPYWHEKLGIPSGQEVKARQVSQRGGDLRLIWDSEKSKISISGAVTRLGKGELSVGGYSA